MNSSQNAWHAHVRIVQCRVDRITENRLDSSAVRRGAGRQTARGVVLDCFVLKGDDLPEEPERSAEVRWYSSLHATPHAAFMFRYTVMIGSSGTCV